MLAIVCRQTTFEIKVEIIEVKNKVEITLK